MKKSYTMSMRYVAVFICSSFILTGCSSIPIRTGRTYFDDHYRRIPYKEEGNYRVIDVFYATNRNMRQTKDSSVALDRNLSRSMTYGTLNIKMNSAIKIGKMVPQELQRDKMIEIQKVSKIGEDEFLKEVADAVKASPHNSLMVVIFGEYDDFKSAAMKAAYFMYHLDINTPVLIFDWPGDQPVFVGSYKRAQEYAMESGPHLEDLLVKITRQVKPEKLWITASSTGSQIVLSAVDGMCKRDGVCDADLAIDHIVLTAPDIGKDEFNDELKKKLLTMARKVTVYFSSNDRALLASSVVNVKPRLGRQTVKEPKQIEEAKAKLYMESLDPGRITFVDVTPINTASFMHGYYLESPEFYDDFYTRIFGTCQNVSRRAYLVKTEDGTDYWVLQADR